MGKRLLIVLAVGSLLVVAGCAGNSKDTQQPTVGNLPTEVQAGFEREFPGATISDVEKEEYPDGTVHYEVKFVTKEGKTVEQEFDAAGKKLGEH